MSNYSEFINMMDRALEAENRNVDLFKENVELQGKLEVAVTDMEFYKGCFENAVEKINQQDTINLPAVIDFEQAFYDFSVQKIRADRLERVILSMNRQLIDLVRSTEQDLNEELDIG